MKRENKRNNKNSTRRGERKPNNKGYSDDMSNQDGSYPQKDRKRGSQHGNNDISWYAQNPQMILDNFSLPFGYPLSSTFTRNLNIPPAVGDRFGCETRSPRVSTPGIATISIIPTYGVAENASDALTVAARSLYSYVRHKNSGQPPFEAPDLMQYLIAMDSAYMFYTYLVRAYGVARTYSFKNRYYPRDILTAMGFDPDDICTHLSKFRSVINYLGTRLSSWAVPMNMSIFKRHMWMFQNIFLDRPSDKAQSYIFVPSLFYKYDEPTGSCIPMNWYDNSAMPIKKTIDECVQFYEDLLAPIFANESINIMSGDILKAYGSDGVYGFASLSDDYTVKPIFAPDLMPEIENIQTLPYSNWKFDVSPISQENGVLKHTISLALDNIEDVPITALSSHRNIMLNFNDTQPTPEEVVYATRLITGYRTELNEEGALLVADAFGSEIVDGIKLFTHASNTVVPQIVPLQQALRSQNGYNAYSGFLTLIGQSKSVSANAFSTSLLSPAHFRYFPRIEISLEFSGTDGLITNSDLAYTSDLDNYTQFDHATLGRMHDTAITSLFGIPYDLLKA